MDPGGELFGQAFENWVYHELAAYRAYRRPNLDISYWRLASGIEVDFVIDNLRLAVEAKAARSVHVDHLRGIRELMREHPTLRRRLVVSLDERPRRTEDGIDILPAKEFARRLWRDELIPLR
jgi:predicted AAA+ superfamily ATPase